MTPTASQPKPPRIRQKHGMTNLLRGRYKLDLRQIDGRSSMGQAMAQYQRDLLADLGGAASLSAQERTLVDMAVKDWIILQSIDGFLLETGLFHKRRRTAYPLTLQRMQIADSLTRRLQALGLQRRARQLPSLSDYLANGTAKQSPTPAHPSDVNAGQDGKPDSSENQPTPSQPKE